MSSSEGMIVVTGASRGVGEAVVKELVIEHGRNVLAIARDARALQALAEACASGPGTVETLVMDLGAAEAPQQVAARVGGRRLAALVNNAGLLITRPFGQWTLADAQQLYQMNATVPLLLTQALAAELDGDPPGHVVNIGSMGGFQGSVKFPGLALYSSSKGAVAVLTECLAEEFKTRGIRCNCLCLGAVDTAMLRAAFPGYQAPTSAAEMGRFVARFALEGHKSFNGKVLPVSASTP